MPAPIDIKVEVAFNATYRTLAASRTWTDITQYVEAQHAMSIEYGRADEVSTVDANRLTGLVLDNRDGRFTLDNASSPYYPNVKVGRPIRVTATIGGVTSVRFTGYVDQWPVAWPGGDDAYATAAITASSRLSRLGLDTPIARPLDQTIVTDLAANYYWPLTEASGATIGREIQDRAPAFEPSFLGPALLGVEFGSGSGDGAASLGDGRSGVKLFKDGDPQGALVTGQLPTGLPFSVGTAFTLGFLLSVIDLDPTPGIIPARVSVQDSQGATVAGFIVERDYPPHLPSLPGPHFVATVVTRTSATTFTQDFYIDGALVRTEAAGTTATTGDGAFVTLTSPSTLDNGRDVNIGRVAAWTRALTPTEMQQVATSGLDAYRGDTVTQRMARYINWAFIPSAEVSIPTSAITMSGVPIAGGQIVTLLRLVETTENGVLYDDRAGNLVLKGRAARYAQPINLSVDLTAQLLGGDYSPKADRQGLANVGTAKNADGTVEVTFTDEASRQEYGDAGYSVETHALDPDEPLMLAAARIAAHSTPRPRAPAATLKHLDWSGADLTALLALDIGSRVQFTGRPSAAGVATVDYFVEGYTESLSPFYGSIALNLSPSAPVSDYFVLDSATDGVLDQNALAL